MVGEWKVTTSKWSSENSHVYSGRVESDQNHNYIAVFYNTTLLMNFVERVIFLTCLMNSMEEVIFFTCLKLRGRRFIIMELWFRHIILDIYDKL